MGNGKEDSWLSSKMFRAKFIFYFPISIFLVSCFLGGCAAPAEPMERKPPVPKAVADLAAAQAGDDVVLTFTLPKETVERRPLKQGPAIEIFRLIHAAGATDSAVTNDSQARVPVVTIPSAMVDQYSDQGHIRAVDSLKAEDFRPNGETTAEYRIRTRVSSKKESADSNIVVLKIYPAAEPIRDLKVETTHAGVILTWTPPQKTLVGSTATIANYRIYRAEMGSADIAAASPLENRKPKTPLLKIGESETATFRDSLAERGKSYIYSVRTVAQYPNGTVESADSNEVEVTPNDIFTPAVPQGLVVVFVPAVAGAPAHIELSWAINPEPDIAGYNIFRTEQEGTAGVRLNPELLLTPAFRDMSTLPGRRYLYTVTAVDRSGNQSPASAAAAGEVPADSQTMP
jgi:hypothetical protein